MHRVTENRKRVRRQALHYDLIQNDERPTKRLRRSTSEPGKDDTRKASLPPVIHPNLEGFIYITPTATWEKLKKDHRTFVLNYNRAVRHDEERPEIPSGVKIGEKKEQDRGVRRIRRNRAMDYFGKKEDDTPSKVQPESDADESIGSLGEIEEDISIKPGTRKK